MEKAIIGRKIGMTQIFDETGLVVPVTVIQAGPMTVIRKKTIERDGYEAAVCAFEDVPARKVNKAQIGELKAAGVATGETAKKIIKEFKLDNVAALEIGSEINCSVFNAGDMIDVSGMTKGHGFSGAIKRWNQHRLKMTHGTGPVHRERGSSGANSTPSRVIKGLHMAGQYGNEKVTILKLKVIKVDAERNILLVRGAIPGPKGGLVTVRSTVK